MPPDNSGSHRPSASGAGEIYVEFKQVGQVMRVSAVDAATGMEVVIMGPVSASQKDLQKVAVAKLKRRLAQEGGKAE